MISEVWSPSLGGSSLFVPKAFEERHHPLPHITTAIALGDPWRHHGAAAAAMET